MIEKAIYTLLAADANVGAICADRISPHNRLQGTALPAVTYELNDLEPFQKLGGNAGLTAATVTITTIAETYSDARSLAEAVFDALDGYSGTSASVVIQSCQYTTLVSTDAGIGEGEEDLPFEFVVTFRIHYEGL